MNAETTTEVITIARDGKPPLKPGGRLVALCADRRNPDFIEWIGDNGGSYESLGVPFAETGTNVRVALVII